MNNSKRCRGSNFTSEEELMLLEEVSKRKSIIECKTTNKTSNEEKEEAWQQALTSFNAKSLRVRTLEQMKTKYDNLKTKARKIVAAERAYIKGTGGGKYKGIITNPVIEAVLNIINVKTVVGLQSSIDCDATILDITPSDNVEIIYKEIDSVLLEEELPPVTFSTPPPQPVPSVSSIVDENVLCELRQPALDLFTESGSSKSTNEMLCEIQGPALAISNKSGPSKSTNQISERDNSENWSSYIPKKLKTKTNSKLRPTMANPATVAKEAYYRRKLELLEEAEAREACDRAKKAKWAEEEHKKKMLLLDLEIAEKEKRVNY